MKPKDSKDCKNSILIHPLRLEVMFKTKHRMLNNKNYSTSNRLRVLAT